jgi:hypothetical protein
MKSSQPTSEAQDLDQLIKRAAQKAVMATDYDDEDAYIIAEQQVEPILRELLSAALAAEREKRIEAERERDEFSKGCDRLAAKLSYERLKQSSETRGLQL